MISDEIERASLYEQAERDAMVELARRTSGPAATGFCLFCSEPLPDGVRFCDHHCRDAYQRVLDAKVRNGKR